jgi:argininosuccinate lyase
MTQARQIWNTSDVSIHPKALAYTVGEDYLMDQNLFFPYDIQASAAHADMLASINLLTEEEASRLKDGLQKAKLAWEKGELKVLPEQEDCHTCIETFLTDLLGDLGKKIHTARSRNDQSLVMIRLYLKDQLQELEGRMQQLIQVWTDWTIHHGDLPMAGYTHLQRAMPTTVGTWLGIYIDALKDLLTMHQALAHLVDQNPLGSGAGFVLPIEVKREVTTKALGFDRTQENPMYCQFSRGFFEGMVLDHLANVHTVLSRWASDMLLFTTQEFNFFDVSRAFTTSSSIMPQKKNQDVFELLRGRLAIVQASATEIKGIFSRLFSGYQRDLQLIKEPLVRGLNTTLDALEIAALITPAITPNETALKASLSEDLYATHRVYDLVKQGVPFREAYAKVKEELI